MNQWPVIFLALFRLVSLGVGEIFTAMADIEVLAHAEQSIADTVDGYIKLEMIRLKKLKELANDYQLKNRRLALVGMKLLENPIDAFLAIKRLTDGLQQLEQLMRDTAAAQQFRENASRLYPQYEDVRGAADALFRLQDTYDLSASEMASGRIGDGSAEKIEMSAADCFQLGRMAYKQGDNYHVILWMQEALDRLSGGDGEPKEADILDYLAYSLFEQGNVRAALELTKRLRILAPEHARAEENLRFYEQTLREGGDNAESSTLPPIVNKRPTDHFLLERDVFERLCRGAIKQPQRMLSKLYCAYKADTPFLRLAPIKFEILNIRPTLTLFKNVISDAEISVIKELAMPKLRRGQVQNPETGKLQDASNRITKSSWLRGKDHPVVERVNARVSDMTNLDMTTAEELQIANYGLGGHYDPHFDASKNDDSFGLDAAARQEFDNRIATVLFYLSQPDAGGATVFVEPPITAWPSKNDALFWYNLLPSGDLDKNTMHAGCPVLSGMKWVANKWIHERGQEWRRPCALARDF